MPELPEVETIARGLARLAGAEIRAVHVARRDYVREARRGDARAIEGRRVAAVTRHGKRLALELDPAGCVLVHLGMSGQVTLEEPGVPRRDHTHLRITLATADAPHEVRIRDPRRFGGVWIDSDGPVPGSAPGAPRGTAARNGARPGPLGPDALAIRPREFLAMLARPRQVKALLLDQRAIAGLGNIYCDEALWAARIHPLTGADTLSDEVGRTLHRHVKRILREAIRHGGSTLRDYRNSDGDEGRFQRRHRVYGREGEPCPRCDATIRRFAAAGRSSHICPRCQLRRTARRRS